MEGRVKGSSTSKDSSQVLGGKSNAGPRAGLAAPEGFKLKVGLRDPSRNGLVSKLKNLLDPARKGRKLAAFRNEQKRVAQHNSKIDALWSLGTGGDTGGARAKEIREEIRNIFTKAKATDVHLTLFRDDRSTPTRLLANIREMLDPITSEMAEQAVALSRGRSASEIPANELNDMAARLFDRFLPDSKDPLEKIPPALRETLAEAVAAVQEALQGKGLDEDAQKKIRRDVVVNLFLFNGIQKLDRKLKPELDALKAKKPKERTAQDRVRMLELEREAGVLGALGKYASKLFGVSTKVTESNKWVKVATDKEEMGKAVFEALVDNSTTRAKDKAAGDKSASSLWADSDKSANRAETRQSSGHDCAEELSESLVESTTEEISEPLVESTTEEISEPLVESTTEEISESLVESTAEEISESLVESTTEEEDPPTLGAVQASQPQLVAIGKITRPPHLVKAEAFDLPPLPSEDDSEVDSESDVRVESSDEEADSAQEEGQDDLPPLRSSATRLSDDELERLRKENLEKKQQKHKKGKTLRKVAQKAVGKLNNVPLWIAQGVQDLYDDAAKKVGSSGPRTERESDGIRGITARAKWAAADKLRKAEMRLLGNLGAHTWHEERIYVAMPAGVRRRFTRTECAENMRNLDRQAEVDPDWLEAVIEAAGPGVDPLAWLRGRLRAMNEGWNPGLPSHPRDEAGFASGIKYYIPFKVAAASVEELRQGISDADQPEGIKDLDEARRLILAYVEGAYAVFQGR